MVIRKRKRKHKRKQKTQRMVMRNASKSLFGARILTRRVLQFLYSKQNPHSRECPKRGLRATPPAQILK